jgi:cell division protease FtsH
MLLGGRAAEEILLQTMTAGAANDIERAVEIARRMVAEFGMSPLGPIHLGKPDEPRSQALLDRIEKATSEIVNSQMKRACDAVSERRASILLLVDGLMKRDTLDSEEILRCFGEAEDAAAA